MTLKWELLVLHKIPSMFGKILVHEVVWRFEQRTFYFGSLRVKLISVHLGSNSRGAKMSLALDELKYVALCSNSNTTSEDVPHVERTYGNFMHTNQKYH